MINIRNNNLKLILCKYFKMLNNVKMLKFL